jgi:Cdc6-like AAA superfamily ATPase
MPAFGQLFHSFFGRSPKKAREGMWKTRENNPLTYGKRGKGKTAGLVFFSFAKKSSSSRSEEASYQNEFFRINVKINRKKKTS